MEQIKKHFAETVTKERKKGVVEKCRVVILLILIAHHN